MKREMKMLKVITKMRMMMMKIMMVLKEVTILNIVRKFLKGMRILKVEGKMWQKRRTWEEVSYSTYF